MVVVGPAGVRSLRGLDPSWADGDSVAEEIASAVTHGVGAGLAIAGMVFLVAMGAMTGGGPLWVTTLAIYGGTLVFLFVVSTLYHAVSGPRAKLVLHALDHAAIFLLIAGSYTPFALLSLGGRFGWSLFALIWVLAAVGILFKVRRVVDNRHSKWISAGLYLGMGWLALPLIGEVWTAVGTGGLVWLLVGGLVYSFGVIFFVWRRLPYNHAVWHLFVLAGSVCHFVAVSVYVLPQAT